MVLSIAINARVMLRISEFSTPLNENPIDFQLPIAILPSPEIERHPHFIVVRVSLYSIGRLMHRDWKHGN